MALLTPGCVTVGSGLKLYPDLCLCWDVAICHFPVEVCLEQLPLFCRCRCARGSIRALSGL